MSTYPSTVDNSTSLPYPTANSPRNNPSLAALNGSQNDAIIALETKIGTGISTPVNNTVLRGNGVGTSTFAQVGLTTDVTGILPIANGGTGSATQNFVDFNSTQTLTNKTLTSATLTTPTITNATLTAVQPAWQTPTLGTGWANFDAGGPGNYGFPQYMKDSLGFVHLRGLAKNSTAAANTNTVNALIFTLPAGYRPAQTMRVMGIIADAFGEVDVKNDGTVVLAGTSSVPTGGTGWVSLNHIIFLAEA